MQFKTKGLIPGSRESDSSTTNANICIVDALEGRCVKDFHKYDSASPAILFVSIVIFLLLFCALIDYDDGRFMAQGQLWLREPQNDL